MKENKISKIIKRLVGVLYYTWAIIYSLFVVQDIILSFHGLSWKSGLLLFVTGLMEFHIAINILGLFIFWAAYQQITDWAKTQGSQLGMHCVIIGGSLSSVLFSLIWMHLFF